MNLCVFVGGCLRWSWTNCTRPHDDGVCFVGVVVVVDDDDGGGGGVEGITYDGWCEEKTGVVGDRTYVDDDLLKKCCCCCSSTCSCCEVSISLLFSVDDGGVGGVDINIICCDVDMEFDDDNGDGDDGDGGCGSLNVDKAWLTRRDEHEYGWSSSIENDGRCLPAVFNDTVSFK